MNTITLNNGIEMPLVGFGTASLPKDNFSEIFSQAYAAGYRKFDTAQTYGSEESLGQAIRQNNIKREDLFITTKLKLNKLYIGQYKYGKRSIFNIRRPKSIKDIIMESFERIDTDYIDLFLVHWPDPKYEKVYKVLEKLYIDGHIRAIGVSSFLPPHIEYLMSKCEIMPAVNQFEISPLNTQKRLLEYCRENKIVAEAMSTFSHFRSNAPRMEIINNPIVIDIAKKYNKTSVQVINKWLNQQGISIVPKSKNPIHIRENIDIFDFVLSKEEMALIDAMDQGKFLNYDPTLATYSVPSRMRDNEWFKHP